MEGTEGGASKMMKSGSAVLFLILVWECSCRSPPPPPAQPEKGSSWPKEAVHPQLMMENPSLFSPRMDYEEWTPLGRGDPLKNDPTYDYVPPVLERVHYWMDPSKRTPDPILSNSAVLHLSSRTESAFTTRPTTPRYQSFQSKESEADSRIDTSSLFDPFFKLMDVSQFNINFNANANYKPAPNRIHRPHLPPTNNQRTQPPQALQRPPYTMLMPPPPPSRPPSPPAPLPSPPPTSFPSTNYITTLPDTTRTTVPAPPTLQPPKVPNNATTTAPAVLANTDNVFKAVAISMPDHSQTKYSAPQNDVTANAPKKITTEPPLRSTDLRLQNSLDHTRPATPFSKLGLKDLSTEEKIVRKGTKVPPRHWATDNRATITPPVTTAKVNALTTDPMFKHYKQPSEPVKGPFYLIIQGHSKVKTYGASKNPVNKLLTSNEIKHEEEAKMNKFEGKGRRLRYDATTPDGGNDLEGRDEEKGSARSREMVNLKGLEETFAKSDGGSSRKRYLGSDRRRKRFANGRSRSGSRRLLSLATEVDCSPEGRNATLSSDNLDLESLIAVSDDYDPEDVANILLKEEGGQGSGFGGLALSIVGRSEDGEEM